MTSMRDAFVHWTAETLDRDPLLTVVLAAIGTARFEALGLMERHPGRVIDVGIREGLAVGVASGLALEGFAPLLHSYAPFLVERAFEQIKLDIVHQGVRALLVSVGASFDASVEGRTHQAPGDVALLQTLPGTRIEIPGHPSEVAGALTRARAHEGLAYVRLSAAANRAPLPPGLTVLRRGHAGAILVLGPLVDAVLEATRDLDLTIVATPTARPLPRDLGQTLGRGPVAVVEPVLEGTSLAPLIEVLGPRPVLAVGVKSLELRRYGRPEDHAVAHGLDPASLRHRLGSLSDPGDGPSGPSTRPRVESA